MRENYNEKNNAIKKYVANYDDRVSNLVRTAIDIKDYCDSKFINNKDSKLKNGGSIDLDKENKFVSKKIILHRANLYGVEQEIRVLQELGLYEGHYIKKNSNELVIRQKGFFDNWHGLNFDKEDQNLKTIVKKNIVKMGLLKSKDFC